MNKQILLGIDIGSIETCAILAEKMGEEIHIIGAGTVKSQGLKRGSITNIDLASKTIKRAVDDAMRQAGVSNCPRATVSISGNYTKSVNSNGIINIPNNEIGTKEINRVMETAIYNANIPSDYENLHVLPYHFKVDEQDEVDDPCDMNGGRLEVSVHIINVQKSSLNNLKKAVNGAGVDIDNIVLSSYASSISTLNEDERELGVAVIDMGGTTCNLAIHRGNSIIFDDFLGIGSAHITNDLSMALHTPLNIAEAIKIEHGSVEEFLGENKLIELPTMGDNGTNQETGLEVIHTVIFARVEETLILLSKIIAKSGLKEHLGGGIVLTGGMTQLKGIRELASVCFDSIPVRIASPKELDGLFDTLKVPAYATAVGLILYSSENFTLYEKSSNKELKHFKKQEPIKIVNNDIIPTKENKQTDEINNSNIDNLENLNPQINANKVNHDLSRISELNANGDNLSIISKMKQWVTQLF